MATRLFFHDAINSLSGTFPSGEQSSVTANYTATGANTLRSMNTTAGASQTSIAATTLAQTAQQIGFYGFFCSPTFDVGQTVGTNGQTITLNIANAESSSSANLWADLRFNIYVWRPSTGAVVGSIQDQGALTGDAEPGSFNSERVNQGTRTGSTAIAALAGDVLICEIWERHTQAVSIAYTGTFYFDGTTVNTTTNATVSNHASFLDFSTDTMTFAAAPVDCALSATFGSIALNSAASTEVGAVFAGTLSGITVTASILMASSAGLNYTFDGVALSASLTAVVSAGASFTFDGVELIADVSMAGQAVDCNFNSAFDGLVLTSTMESIASMGLSATFSAAVLTAVAALDLSFSGALAAPLQGLTFSGEAFIVPQITALGANMNDSLYRWLGNRGFTGALEDRVKQYLVAQTTGTGLETIEDLWITFGATSGYGEGIQEIQLNWAIDQGATSTLTWSDAMGSLPV